MDSTVRKGDECNGAERPCESAAEEEYPVVKVKDRGFQAKCRKIVEDFVCE